MTPSQVRAELLGEHFELRGLVEAAREILRSDPAPDALRAAMDRLADALLAHSRHEEEAVRVILKPLAARPAGRTAVMDEEHVAEHARLVSVLRESTASEDASARLARVGELLDELESHMTIEEEVLLAEDLLDDR
jgi:iron-sulfur cluster repair protein YtfE (RIC family)